MQNLLEMLQSSMELGYHAKMFEPWSGIMKTILTSSSVNRRKVGSNTHISEGLSMLKAVAAYMSFARALDMAAVIEGLNSLVEMIDDQETARKDTPSRT
jgi:hypothetical protein